jgi:hypothetical protein
MQDRSTLLSLFSLSSPTGIYPQTECISLSCPFFKMYINCSRGVGPSISGMNVLYFNQINPFYYLFFLYCPASLLINRLEYIILYCLYTQIHCVSIFFTLYHSLTYLLNDSFIDWLNSKIIFNTNLLFSLKNIKYISNFYW